MLISMCAHVLKLCRASVNAPGGLVASRYTSLMSNLISNPGTAAIFRGEGFLWQTFWNRDMSKLVWQELVIYKKSDCSILWRKYLICAMNVEITKWCFWELFYSLHKVNDCKNTKWQTPSEHAVSETFCNYWLEEGKSTTPETVYHFFIVNSFIISS